ncbi:MAG TPA: alpha-L-arabinofuranosidase C-terminal domain-containing protein [Clostridiaceae bacterium]
MLITLLKHADRVKIACLAQLVNVIAPIMTSKEEGIFKQTIFYPLLHTSLYGRGTVLNSLVDGPVYDSKDYTDVPYLDSTCVLSENEEELTIFAINKSEEEELVIDCRLENFNDFRLLEHIELKDADRYAVNSFRQPNKVTPKTIKNSTVFDDTLKIKLSSLSWNVIRLCKIK